MINFYFPLIFLAYLKEPQATPLVPSYMNGNGSSTIFFGHNSILFIGMCVAIILLMILLIIVLISKKHRKSEDKRLSTTEALVKTIDVIDNDIQTIRSGKNDTTGIDNLAFERERQTQKPPPVINFPLPPSEKRPTSTSRYFSSILNIIFNSNVMKRFTILPSEC